MCTQIPHTTPSVGRGIYVHTPRLSVAHHSPLKQNMDRTVLSRVRRDHGAPFAQTVRWGWGWTQLPNLARWGLYIGIKPGVVVHGAFMIVHGALMARISLTTSRPRTGLRIGPPGSETCFYAAFKPCRVKKVSRPGGIDYKASSGPILVFG